MSSQEPSAGPDREPRVAEVLESLRAGVRQRRAELATLGERGDELRLALVELKTREFIEEPVCVSPRPVVGPLLVFVRKAVFHLFFKWYARPVLQQQNAYNQAAGRLIQGFASSIEELQRRLDTLAGRVEALAARAGEAEAPEERGRGGA